MTILEKVKMLWHDSEETNMHAIKGDRGQFDLFLDTLLIGSLLYENNKWKFSYSSDFRKQTEFSPLVNFPDVNMQYESDQLWPFFTSRLPGINQLKDSKDDKLDIITLLRKYGQHVIANPYVLNPVH